MNKRFLSLLILLALLVQYLPARAQSGNDWLAGYLQPGEKVVTLKQGLKYNGEIYQIHYFTTGDLHTDDSYFIARASPDYFKKLHVTALLVSSNGKVVTDEAIIEQVLLLYRAAHYLYNEQSDPPFNDPADVAREMKRFTNLPIFLQFWERLVLNQLFKTRDEEYAEALRGILSTQLEMPTDLKLAVDESVKRAERNPLLGDAIEAAIISNDALSRSRQVRRNAKDWEKAVESWQKYTEQGRSYVEWGGKRIEFFNALDLYVLATRLIWITNLQKDRSQELGMFVDQASGEAVFDPDMLRAFVRVSAETDNAWLQRSQIMLDFVGETGVNLAERLTTQALTNFLVKKSGTILSSRITWYALGHALSLASIGYILGDFLFGIDDTYHNFHIGVRTDELRQKLQAGRKALIQQTRIQSVPNFDGARAEQYRAVYLLEAYASARVFRLYADGVQASARSGIIDPIKKLFGQEYSTAGEGLRQTGLKIEADAEETLGNPSFIADAQRLIHNRLLLTSLTVDDSSAGFSPQGKTSSWTPLSAGYQGAAIWTYNQSANSANSATWELTLPEAGRFLVQAYIPEPTREVTKPFSAKATYAVTHAGGTTEVSIDQAGKAGKWADLGLYDFDRLARVHLDDQTGEPQGQTAVVFDAVRFIPEDQMNDLLQGEPFNFEHALQELQTQAQDWWNRTSQAMGQAFNQWWADQQQQIQRSFDQWWQEQQKKMADAWNQWWQDIQRQLAQWLEQQAAQWLNQMCGTALLPGMLAGVLLLHRKRRR